jgi:hypothetical protein
MHYIKYLVIAVLICATVCQCNSLRTRSNQIRVARVRQLRDAQGDE